MRLRPYIESKDFEYIKNWSTDERTHALWCANRFAYPVEKENFHEVLALIADRFGDCPFVATEDDGTVIGFFCYSLNLESNEGMLKFVMIDPALRGKGNGKAMLQLALDYAFQITKAAAVNLSVFTDNPAAQKCYESVGFTIKKTELNAFPFKDESWGRCNMTKENRGV
ncbi:MAG: GNAT family N-acetyltransferase [Lachnospiraceae bacterium]|nr:GNAT family N-acetyltransferase [Lachnospiraceae bacterium]